MCTNICKAIFTVLKYHKRLCQEKNVSLKTVEEVSVRLNAY